LVNLGLEQLTFRITTGLAERYPAEQFLPEEINDALISVVNSVGETALRVAIRNSLAQLEAGIPVEELGRTLEIETSERFATADVPREEIVSSIEDLSGLDESLADSVLQILEQAVDEPVFGLRKAFREDMRLEGVGDKEEVRFEGIGIIRAGNEERSYYIVLEESLRVPPLKNLSSLSRYQRANERTARQDSRSASV
jgi:hypothetical protein